MPITLKTGIQKIKGSVYVKFLDSKKQAAYISLTNKRSIGRYEAEALNVLGIELKHTDKEIPTSFGKVGWN